MPNTYFQFKQFRIEQAQSGMKVTTDACLFGAWVAKMLKTNAEPRNILDIGTGTGLLSLMLAQETEQSRIDAIEVNELAFAEALDNFSASPWSDRLSCEHVSLQKFKTGSYDIVICNPPFFTGSQLGINQGKNQALHTLLLPGDELLNGVLNLLSEKGSCYVLYPEKEMKSFLSMANDRGLKAKKIVTIRNEKQASTFRLMAELNRTSDSIKRSEILIREPEGHYTAEFWNLLQPYYLEYNNPVNGQ